MRKRRSKIIAYTLLVLLVISLCVYCLNLQKRNNNLCGIISKRESEINKLQTKIDSGILVNNLIPVVLTGINPDSKQLEKRVYLIMTDFRLQNTEFEIGIRDTSTISMVDTFMYFKIVDSSDFKYFRIDPAYTDKDIEGYVTICFKDIMVRKFGFTEKNNWLRK